MTTARLGCLCGEAAGGGMVIDVESRLRTGVECSGKAELVYMGFFPVRFSCIGNGLRESL